MRIKDHYDLTYMECIAGQIGAVYPAFAADSFIAEAGAQLEGKSYSQRLELIAAALHRHLPDYGRALGVFHTLLGEKLPSMAVMYELGRPYAPFGKFVELYAVENEGCLCQTLDYIYELTQRYSGEFAMRPLLAAFPERTLAVLRTWAGDESDCVRRLASECMRPAIPWGRKLDFPLEHFDGYCEILLALAGDRCEYVRRSVANNLNELWKADAQKARVLTEKLGAMENPYKKTLLTHGTRWARKKGLIQAAGGT